jgi:hypothetical protein
MRCTAGGSLMRDLMEFLPLGGLLVLSLSMGVTAFNGQRLLRKSWAQRDELLRMLNEQTARFKEQTALLNETTDRLNWALDRLEKPLAGGVQGPRCVT